MLLLRQYQQLPCRKWPVTVKEKSKKELDRLLDLDVITLVDKPIDWISSVVAAVKPNGKDRLRIDPKPLNKAVKRNDCPMKTIAGVLEELLAF